MMRTEETMKDFANFDGSDDVMKEAEKALGTLNGKSESDIIREIYKKAEEGKLNGTLTNEQIDAFYERFSQLLDPPRKKKLRKMVEKLKEIKS